MRRPGRVPGVLRPAARTHVPLTHPGHGLTREWGAGSPRPWQRHRVSVTEGPSCPWIQWLPRRHAGHGGAHRSRPGPWPASLVESSACRWHAARPPPAGAGSTPEQHQALGGHKSRGGPHSDMEEKSSSGLFQPARIASQSGCPSWTARCQGSGDSKSRRPEHVAGVGLAALAHRAWVVPSSACSGQCGHHSPVLPERDTQRCCHRVRWRFLSQMGRELSVHAPR